MRSLRFRKEIMMSSPLPSSSSIKEGDVTFYQTMMDKTILEQEYKKKTYDKLCEQNLPIPLDLLEEMQASQYIKKGDV